MDRLPDKLIPKNQSQFSEYKLQRELRKLRQRVVEFMVNNERTQDGKRTVFDLKSVSSNDMYSYAHIDDRLIESIRSELHTLGWKTKTAYCNTTLFIYDNEDEVPVIEGYEEL